jgi:hypothetical protein
MKWRKVKDPDNTIYGGNFCPKCYDGFKIYFRQIGKYLPSNEYNDNNYEYKCDNCGWIGKPSDILLLDEMININRTELIDKILDGK